MCPERHRLSEIVARAVTDVYMAKDAHDHARLGKQDHARLSVKSAMARTAQLAAGSGPRRASKRAWLLIES
jgi:hypothetical protein